MRIEVRERSSGGWLWRLWDCGRSLGWGVRDTRDDAQVAAREEATRLARAGLLEWTAPSESELLLGYLKGGTR